MTTPDSQRAIRALLELSGFTGGEYVDRMEKLIAKAPDPETACQVITDEFQATGALERQWRKIISQTWHTQHKIQSHPFTLPLTSEEVLQAPALLDARRLLDELVTQPVKIEKTGREATIASSELPRLVKAMPSLANVPLPEAFEHEWSIVRLRRMREILQTLRLVRVYGGKLQIVQSRYNQFQDLPLPQQYYVLWHADIYHISWADYAASWGQYIDVVQEYIPILWDISRGTRAGQTQTTLELTFSFMDIYQALWEQENIAGHKRRSLFDMYRETALPGVMEQMLVRDVFIRYGLLEAHEGIHALMRSDASLWIEPQRMVVRWTNVGEKMLNIERSGELPCAFDILA